MIRGFLAALCACGCVVYAAETPLIAQDIWATLGNGRLTIGLGETGRINVCRWPSPGLADQISVTKDLTPEDGLFWGGRIGSDLYWLTGEPWNMGGATCLAGVNGYEILSALPGQDIVAAQTVFVHPARDVLVLRLTLNGLSAPPTIYWYANLTPCTRLISELPLADAMLDQTNDFAAFVAPNKDAVFHFRPSATPGKADWNRANELAEKMASPTEWETFGEGVWAGYTSPDAIINARCGIEHEPSSVLVSTGDRFAAVGACNSMIEIAPTTQNKMAVATVFLAFGETYQQASDTLTEALRIGYDRLFAEAQQDWSNWLDTVNLPQTSDNAVMAWCKAALVVLAACTDAAAGAIVRSPAAQPSLAMDWVRDGVWATLAYDMAGLNQQAEQHIRFYLKTVRQKTTRGKPAGSLPAACYANGVEALPHVVLDVDGAAWFLWSVWRHGQFLSEDARLAFWHEIWEQIEPIADFTAGWANGLTGAAIPSFDPSLYRDHSSLDSLFIAYLGLEGALAICRDLERAEPDEWLRRKRELDTLIRFHFLNSPDSWQNSNTFVLFLTGIFRPEDAHWESLIHERISVLPQLRGHEAAHVLLELAYMSEERSDIKEKLQPHLGEIMKTILQPAQFPNNAIASPDSLLAAQTYIAVMKLHSKG